MTQVLRDILALHPKNNFAQKMIRMNSAKNRKKLGLVFMFVALISCGDNSEGIFTGITETDEQGVLMGSVDDTDWGHTDSWGEKEENLFNPANFTNELISYFDNRVKVTDAVSPSSSFHKIGPAYPNPVRDIVVIPIRTNVASVKMVLVNENFDTLLQIETSNTIELVISNVSGVVANQIYRLYYQMEFEDGTLERGHGDIKMI